jgi:hypothetical protein
VALQTGFGTFFGSFFVNIMIRSVKLKKGLNDNTPYKKAFGLLFLLFMGTQIFGNAHTKKKKDMATVGRTARGK